jgi:hypothetical protein
MLFSVTAAEVNRAVTLAEKAITSTARPTDYQLISAINLVAGSEYRGPAFWRLRFKRRDLIPADAEGVLGAGGELLVDVDVHTGVATLVGHGE